MTKTTRTATSPPTTYRAGSPWLASTTMPANVTGECSHEHRTAEAAQRCIDAFDRAVKHGHGPDAYADRCVMVEHHGDAPRHPLALEADCPICNSNYEADQRCVHSGGPYACDCRK